MRLIRLEKLERSVEAQAAPAAGVGIVWSTRDVRLAPGALKPGEFLACDVTITGEVGGVPTWRIEERATRNRSDLGFVFDAAGVQVGRVTSLDGTLIGWRAEGEGLLEATG